MQLTRIQADFLSEMINIGAGKAAGALNQMTRSHIRLTAPLVRLLERGEFAEHIRSLDSRQVDLVKLVFTNGFSGVTLLVFSAESSVNLVGLLLGHPDARQLEQGLREDTIREVGNIVLIWIMGAMAGLLGEHLDYEPLTYGQVYSALLEPHLPAHDVALLLKTEFGVQDHVIEGEVIILFNSADFAHLLQTVDRLTAGATAALS